MDETEGGQHEEDEWEKLAGDVRERVRNKRNVESEKENFHVGDDRVEGRWLA